MGVMRCTGFWRKNKKQRSRHCGPAGNKKHNYCDQHAGFGMELWGIVEADVEWPTQIVTRCFIKLEDTEPKAHEASYTSYHELSRILHLSRATL
jgi:hypothetical protein